MVPGELSVMMAGMITMHKWYADNLEKAILILVSSPSIISYLFCEISYWGTFHEVSTKNTNIYVFARLHK